MTNKQIILKVLESHYPGWVPNYHLMSTSTPWGWIGSEGKRRCRELHAAGKIEHKEIDGNQHYRILKKRQQLPLV